MINLNLTERLILIELGRVKNSLFVYTLYRKYDLDINEISKAVKRLSSIGIILYNDMSLRFTSKGRELLQEYNLYIFNKDDLPWRKCPNEFTRDVIEFDDYYIPNIKLLDKKTFSFLKTKKGGA